MIKTYKYIYLKEFDEIVDVLKREKLKLIREKDEY
jgi:hypothetical protein